MSIVKVNFFLKLYAGPLILLRLFRLISGQLMESLEGQNPNL